MENKSATNSDFSVKCPKKSSVKCQMGLPAYKIYKLIAPSGVQQSINRIVPSGRYVC